MPSAEHSRQSRFIPKADAACYPISDLTGRQQRQQLHETRMTRLKEQLSREVTRELRQLLGHVSLEARIGDDPTASAALADYWLTAESAETEGRPLVLAASKQSLFQLSDLFFGATPTLISDKVLEQRVISDTEERLVHRLLSALVMNTCRLLGLPDGNWQSQTHDTAPATGVSWSELVIAAEDWSFPIHLGWPERLTLPEDTPRPGKGAITRARLEQTLRRVPLQLKVELATVDLTLDRLGDLNPGDMLAIDLAGPMPVRGGQQLCLKGQVCEDSNRLALNVTHTIGDLG